MTLTFLLGIWGFLITSLDDFFVLCHLFMKHKRKFWSIVLGTSAGLAVVVLGSWIAPNAIKLIGINLEKWAPFLIASAMLYVANGIIKDDGEEAEEDPFAEVKASLKVFTTAGWIYITNGTDDLVTYVSFLAGYSQVEQSFYIAGIFTGLVILCFLAYWSKNKIDQMPEERQEKIKKSFAIVAVIIAIIYLGIGVNQFLGYKKGHSLLFFLQKTLYKKHISHIIKKDIIKALEWLSTTSWRKKKFWCNPSGLSTIFPNLREEKISRTSRRISLREQIKSRITLGGTFFVKRPKVQYLLLCFLFVKNSSMKQTTLGIIVQNGKILLGMKKVRFGAGKWNGPGGKVDIGETIEECMQRETFEEFGISINTQTMKKVGVFDWINKANQDQNHIVNIFLISEFTGTPVESEEMKPEWFSLDKIPYDQMWEDDRTWLPRVLNGEYIEYEFVYGVDGKIESLTLKK